MAQLHNEKSTTVPVARGLYVLRYIKAKDRARAPTIFVRSSPGMEEEISIITAPDLDGDRLARPGTGLVVMAESPGYLVIVVRSQRPGGSVEAELRLEPLSHEGEAIWEDSYDRPVKARARLGRSLPESYDRPAPAARSRPSQQPAVWQGDDEDGRFLFHLARQGDVVTAPDEWAGGPDAPAYIEGLELQAPHGLQLEYQVMAAGSSQRWSPWMADGEFAGSRGEARYLTGLRMRLSGDDSDQMVLDVEALFLDSSRVHKKGATVSLVSATGTEPIVGLRIGMKPRTQAARPAAPAPAPVSKPVQRRPARFQTIRSEPEPDFEDEETFPPPTPEPPAPALPPMPEPTRSPPSAPQSEGLSRPRVRVFRASKAPSDA